jgi:hypothetical protein
LKAARAAWPLLAGLLIGLAAGAVWTLLQPDRHRAETRVLVRGDARGLVPAVKALAESSLLEQNLAQTLRLKDTPEITAAGGTGGVLTLSAEAGSSERARQIDGEAAIVLGRLVTTRFGPGAEATLLDPAQTVEQTSPTPGRNLLIAGLIGLALGAAAAPARTRRPPTPAPEPIAVDPDLEPRLQARIDAIAKRELALARRAGELADRESRLRQREEELTAAPPPAPVEELEPEPEPELEPEPVVEEPAPAPTTRGQWTLDALEDLVLKQGADAAQHEEWTTYLFFLREHASVDGTLPPSFNALVNEVFGPLVARGPDE